MMSFVALTLVAHVRGTCFSDADCSYNGRCVDKDCVCESAWRGVACDELQLLSASSTGGYSSHHGPEASRTSSCGCSVLFDDKDGRWHMFAAEMINDCGIDYWEPNSRVVHAVSSSPEGPFSYVSTVIPAFAH